MSIMNLTCLIKIVFVTGDISPDNFLPHERRNVSADTDSNFDFTNISNDYTPKAGHIKSCFLKLKDFSKLPAIHD